MIKTFTIPLAKEITEASKQAIIEAAQLLRVSFKLHLNRDSELRNIIHDHFHVVPTVVLAYFTDIEKPDILEVQYDDGISAANIINAINSAGSRKSKGQMRTPCMFCNVAVVL